MYLPHSRIDTRYSFLTRPQPGSNNWSNFRYSMDMCSYSQAVSPNELRQAFRQRRREVRYQRASHTATWGKILFLAAVPSLPWRMVGMREESAPASAFCPSLCLDLRILGPACLAWIFWVISTLRCTWLMKKHVLEVSLCSPRLAWRALWAPLPI